MAVAASSITRIASAQDAVDHALALARAGDSVADAVSATLATLDLSDAARDELVRAGMEARVFVALGASNHAAKVGVNQQGASPLTPMGSASGLATPPPQHRSGKTAARRPHAVAQWWRSILAGTNYAGADGVRKSLLDFTLADATRLLADSTAKRAGYDKLVAAMTAARDALSATGAKSVRALPDAEQQKIASALR